MLRQLALAGAAGFILSACEHYGHDGDSGPKGANDTIDVTAAVKISRDSSGNFAFEYDAPFFDRKGNFDFSQDGAFGNAVNMSFEIADGSIDGLKFRSDPRDAIWIVEKENVDPKTGSPAGPYRGQQFFNFRVSEDGRRLTLTDANNDGVLYRYGLRYDLGGEIVFDDPDGQNGGVRD